MLKSSSKGGTNENNVQITCYNFLYILIMVCFNTFIISRNFICGIATDLLIRPHAIFQC